MLKNEIMNNEFQRREKRKITPMLTIFLVVLFTLSTANTILTCSATTSCSADLKFNEKVLQEKYMDEDYHYTISTLMLYRDSIIRLNISLLLSSYSSVEICTSEQNAQEFSPFLTNFTLAPGESFTEDYTFIVGVANEVAYECRLTLPNSNATVQWWYDVLYSAKANDGIIGIEAFFVGVSFIISGITLVFITKRKSNKKNN
ncbi:MAG: hypothetical protein ACTSPM_06835 [Candidatus Heimdallarchaeota archaeon]